MVSCVPFGCMLWQTKEAVANLLDLSDVVEFSVIEGKAKVHEHWAQIVAVTQHDVVRLDIAVRYVLFVANRKCIGDGSDAANGAGERKGSVSTHAFAETHSLDPFEREEKRGVPLPPAL